MKAFHYVRVTDAHSATTLGQAQPARFLAGGTNLLDLMREGIEQPDTVVDIARLPLATIEALPGGGLRIGAMVRNSVLADNERVRTMYPLLSQAILNGAPRSCATWPRRAAT